MSALCKLHGRLVVMSTTAPTLGMGRCPVCKGANFYDAPYGWAECATDECDFAVLKEHLKRMPDDVNNLLGAYI